MLQDPVFLVAANLAVAVLIRMLKPNLLTALLLAIVLIMSTGYLGSRHGAEVAEFLYRGRDLALEVVGESPAWPPVTNRTYPDLELVDQNGEVTRLSDFRGKLILVEPVGISCPACVAFAGGHRRGDFQGVDPQANLQSIWEYAAEYGPLNLDDPEIVYVQLILFGQTMEAPTLDEVRAWAEHFGMERAENLVVLAGTPAMVSQASRDMIPGFQLIDRDFTLRADSTGDTPADDLYSELLPLLKELLNEPPPESIPVE